MGHMEQIPIVPITSNVLKKYGLKPFTDRPYKIADITIYPLGLLLSDRIPFK